MCPTYRKSKIPLSICARPYFIKIYEHRFSPDANDDSGKNYYVSTFHLSVEETF